MILEKDLKRRKMANLTKTIPREILSYTQ
jgi:hypothetical protein